MTGHFDILGKDFLSVAEAAHYCCLSPSQFGRKVEPQIPVHDFCGKKIYRVADLRGLMEKSPLWQRSTNAVNRMSSTGVQMENSIAAHWARFPNSKRKAS